MFPIAELAQLILQTAVASFTQPSFLLIFGAVLFLVYTQYRRMAAAELQMYGMVINSPRDQLLNAIWAGLAGGLVGTVLFVFPGIALPGSGIYYIWMIALLLALIHPRFICFAYGGGLVALSSLLFGEPQINVGALMALVAILHLVEAVLIRLQGARNVTPVYTRRSDGRVVGGFLLQKFWPLPFVALLGVMIAGELPEGAGLAMPAWWPLIGAPEVDTPGISPFFMLLPVVAALDYGDIALTSSPQAKARRTSQHLLIYSLCLLVLAALANTHFLWALAAALFSPLAHELVIYLGRRKEEKGVPVYTAEKGAVILAVLPDSPASAMGLGPGDIIRTINGYSIANRHDVLQAISPWAFELLVEVEDGMTGAKRTARYQGRVPPLGIIFAPEGDEQPFMHLDQPGWVVRMWRRRMQSKTQ